MPISKNKRYSIFLYTGFGLLLSAFVFLAFFHFKQITQSNEILSETIKNNDTQLRAAMDMRVAVRERAILLWHMSFNKDAFVRDELYMHFYVFGSRFSDSRLEYLSTTQTELELKLIGELDKETNKRAPQLRRFAEMLMNKPADTIHFAELDKAIAEQYVVADILDKIISVQQTQNEKAHKQTAEATTEILSELIIWILIFIFAVILFARVIVKVANEQSNELSKVNNNLNLLARKDHLTNLPNRLFLSEHLELTLAHARRHNKKGALIYIDLDGFKPINDNYGHDIGDAYLQAISKAASDLLRESDMLARLGGDEFLVVLYEIHSANDAITVANKLLKILSSEYTLDGISIKTSASLGICLFPNDEMSVGNLLSSADAAMYNAKKAGKNRYYI